VLAARGTPQLEAGHPAEHKQRLTDGAGGSLHEHALSSLHARRAVKELVRSRPAQNQRGRLRRVEARRHAGQVAGPERAIGGVRPEYRHIGDPVAKLKAAHAIADLIDFPDDVIAEHERRAAGGSLRVKVAPDRHVRVFKAGGEHADPHLASPGCRQRSLDQLEPLGTAEAPDLNNLVARLCHGRIPCNSADIIARKRDRVLEDDQCVNTAFLVEGPSSA